ncbi:MAG TPA: hypothetical protein PK733_10815 [Clostridiales bacterium]|nr:hypothetical protein [Clostridiales bacterium]
MSVFYYYISKKQLPSQVIEKAHSINYSLNEITRFVKDAKKGYCYYNCDPVSVYISTTKAVNINEIINYRHTKENNYLLWLAEEFRRLGYFNFIRVWEDNTKCDTGYYEAFFKKCKHTKISYIDFCWCLASNERGLEDDVLYKVR